MWELRPLHDSAALPKQAAWWLPGAAEAAAWLRHRVPAGGRIAIRAAPTPGLAALIQGAWAAGVCLVPIHRRLTTAEARLLIERAKVHDVIGDEVPAFSAPGIPEHHEHDPNSLAAIVFTSGTSGSPKAVRLSRRALAAAAQAAVSRLELTARDRWCACLPLDHIGGISVLLRSAFCGYTIDLHPHFELSAIRENLAVATGVSLVPTMLHRLVKDLQARGATWPLSLRTLLIGGGPLDHDLAETSRALGCAPCQTYGLTECASQVCTLAPSDTVAGLGTAGYPVPGMEVRISPDGHIGVRGESLMDGYDGEASPFDADGWFSTGDVGEWDSAGRLRVLGRHDEILISGGENIAPHDIEAVLERHPGIREAGVYGVADPGWGTRVCVALVPATVPLSDQEVQIACAALADFKRPKTWNWVEKLPRTATGKLQRRQLQAALLQKD